VIVTGETAKKQNADRILAALAGLAGEFRGHVAGPHLEGALAGHGSGAAAYAAATSQPSPISISAEEPPIGPRFRQTGCSPPPPSAAGAGCSKSMADSAGCAASPNPPRAILAACRLLSPGDPVDLATLRRFTDQMAALTVELVHGTASRWLSSSI
jgi:ethanolamine utilization protein EutA